MKPSKRSPRRRRPLTPWSAGRAGILASTIALAALCACADGGGDADPADAAGPVGPDAPVAADGGGTATPDALGADLGQPCTTSSECEGGYCVAGPDGDVCTYECTGDCGPGWACRVVDVGGGALVSVCVPVVVRQCTPCTGDDQCPGGACIELEGEGYCLAGCFESACPDGTECKEDPTGEHPGPYCIPKTGSCSCSPGNEGAVRTCSVENAIGTCWGLEVCDPDEGWTGCTAPTAEPEICDGLDNDCDALIDDGVGGGAPCDNELAGVGSCPGQSVCTGVGGLICQGPLPAIEVCNYADDDCDGAVDEGFAGLGSVCSDGVGACERFGVVSCTADGAGTACSAEAGAPLDELCNGIDDDCDAAIDEDFPELGDPCTAGVGICERTGSLVCSGDGTGTVCSAVPGAPEVTDVCNGLDDDCNGVVDDGYLNPLTGVYDQDFACGSCAVDCTDIYDLPNASGSCVVDGAPGCVMSCDPGTFDLNGALGDGCEFVLDPGAIYVSASDPGAHDDGGCGLGPVGTGPDHYPCRTIGHGIGRANGTNRARVLVANGLYPEAVVMANGRSLLGGYQWDTWERNLGSTSTMIYGVSSTGAHDRTVVANGITAPTVFEGFVVLGSVNGKTGGNSYALYVSASSSNLVIRHNLIVGGRGGPGAAGGIGSDGLAGVDGTGRASNPNGYDAKIATGSGYCNASNNRSYANGGVRTCGGDDVSGGHGGGNRCEPVSTLTEYSGLDGVAGQAGAGGGGGAGGAGADAGDDMRLVSNGTLCYVPDAPDYGADGEPGLPAAHGVGASGCTAAAGSVSGGHWVGAVAPSGASGANGGGGGGGGAGGGSYCQSCPQNKDRLGGHGGGGGSGGCGGAGGAGGATGGGAFGIFIVGGSAPVITNNSVMRGEGGTGGSGGSGGTGGEGGSGAAGGTSTLFCAGRAGRGGNGGDGGHGAGGGGGCGGTSIAIFTSGIGTPNYCTLAAANTISGGVAGAGGPGGYSLVNLGTPGSPGLLTTCAHQ